MKEIEFNKKEEYLLVEILKKYPKLAKQQLRAAKLLKDNERHKDAISKSSNYDSTEEFIKATKEGLEQSKVFSSYFINKIKDEDDIQEVYIN